MRAFALFTLLLLACLSSPAVASAVVIWPVDPVIAPGDKAAALWLENKGDAPVTLQVRTFAWTQPEGEERLDTQDSVVASPPIATVAPGARQLVRIIRRAAGTVPESAFRLLIDELPPPPPTGPDGPTTARLAVQMRYSVPLFTYAGAPTPAQLDTRIAAGPEGRVLVIRNTGQRHARLTDLRLISSGHETVLRAGLAGYVLAGATLRVPIAVIGAGTLKARVDGVDQTLGTAA